MSHLQAVMPNRKPTEQETAREVLFLDSYGMTASAIVKEYPVDLGQYIRKQALLNPLIAAMASDGWAFAGSGYFSAVFVKDGLALKIGFKVNDTGAMFAAWCRSNKGLAGVPEVYSITKFSGCYLVLTRRYDEVRDEWLKESGDEYVPEMDKEFHAIADAVNRGKNWGVRDYDTAMTGASIREFFNDVADFDLHSSNVMLDHSGEFVITDPISHGTCSADPGYYTTDTTTVT